MGGVDDHQRRLLRDMEHQVQRFREGALAVDVLARNLLGLFQAADFQSSDLRDDFLSVWTCVEAEAELRTEHWAPPDLESDAALRDHLDVLVSWVQAGLAADNQSRA